MSTSYKIPAKVPHYEVIVGWNAPESTYYLHVIDTKKSPTDPGYWIEKIGTAYGEYYDPDAFNAIVEQYGTIPDDVWEKLCTDPEY